MTNPLSLLDTATKPETSAALRTKLAAARGALGSADAQVTQLAVLADGDPSIAGEHEEALRRQQKLRQRVAELEQAVADAETAEEQARAAEAEARLDAARTTTRGTLETALTLAAEAQDELCGAVLKALKASDMCAEAYRYARPHVSAGHINGLFLPSLGDSIERLCADVRQRGHAPSSQVLRQELLGSANRIIRALGGQAFGAAEPSAPLLSAEEIAARREFSRASMAPQVRALNDIMEIDKRIQVLTAIERRLEKEAGTPEEQEELARAREELAEKSRERNRLQSQLINVGPTSYSTIGG